MSMDSNYLKRYLFSFEGRVTRLEYWMFYVPLIIGYIIVFIFAAVFGEEAATIMDPMIIPIIKDT